MIIGMLCLRLEVVHGLEYRPLVLAGLRLSLSFATSWSVFLALYHLFYKLAEVQLRDVG